MSEYKASSVAAPAGCYSGLVRTVKGGRVVRGCGHSHPTRASAVACVRIWIDHWDARVEIPAELRSGLPTPVRRAG